MTEASRSPAIPTQGLLAARNSLPGRQNNGDSAGAVRFVDVLAESKAPVVRDGGGRASPEQMFEANIQNTRERRKYERRSEYRQAVDRRSAARAEERTGVNARRSETSQPESANAAMATMPAKPSVERNTGTALQEAASPEPQAHSSPSPEETSVRANDSSQMIDQQTRNDEASASGAREKSTVVVPALSAQSRPIGSVSMAGAADGQAASELARLLASPAASNGGRDAASIQSVLTGRSEKAPAGEAKGTRDSGLAKDSSQATTTSSKSSASSNVSEFERLIRLVRSQPGRQSSTRVLLDPPELGRVHVRVLVDGDRVEVGVETENDAARQMISERATKLRTALEQHGLVIDRFDVTTNHSGLFEQRFFAGQEALRPRHDQNTGGSGREFAGRSRRAPADIRMTAAVEAAGAIRLGARELDIQV